MRPLEIFEGARNPILMATAYVPAAREASCLIIFSSAFSPDENQTQNQAKLGGESNAACRYAGEEASVASVSAVFADDAIKVRGEMTRNW